MAGEDYYGLFMDEEPTAQEKARLISEALMRKRASASGNQGLAMGASLGANPLLQGIQGTSQRAAQMMDQNADTDAKMLAGAGQERAGNKLRALLAREAATARAGEHADRLGMDKAQLAEQRRHNQAMEARDGGAKADARAAEKLDRQAQDLSKGLEGLPSLRLDMMTLDKFAGEEDIPGIGKGAGMLPNWAISDDGKRVRQATRGIISAIIKKQSGTAASEGEIQRKKEELGIDDTATEAEFKLGLRRLKQQALDEFRTTEAGVSPEAVKLVRERGGMTSADLPVNAPEDQVQAPRGPSRTINGETRYWDGKAWVK